MVEDTSEIPARKVGRPVSDPLGQKLQVTRYRETPDKLQLMVELAKKLGITPSQLQRDALSDFLIKHRMIQ